MTFSIHADDAGVTTVVIEGELDAVTVGDLRAALNALLDKRPRRIRLDLSRLRMIDSSGVGAVVSLYKRVRAQGGEMVVEGLRDQPLAIFRLLRLDRLLAAPTNLAP